MNEKVLNNKTDKAGYNDFYKEKVSNLSDCSSSEEYIELFEKTGLSPFYIGGETKGYVRGRAVKSLFNEVNKTGRSPGDITILDAGCGLGELSVYLAASGFNVIGVDISKEACISAEKLAQQVGVNRCRFLDNSLEKIEVEDNTVDYVIGHASLHHFIKYENVPEELYRVMKVGSKGFFADSFGENKLYHIFHNKEEMERLGDVILTRRLVMSYFDKFKTEITPTDWFVMFDKLYLKIFPKKFTRIVRSLSTLHFYLDRLIPKKSRVALFFSGAIMTKIKKK